MAGSGMKSERDSGGHEAVLYQIVDTGIHTEAQSEASIPGAEALGHSWRRRKIIEKHCAP